MGALSRISQSPSGIASVVASGDSRVIALERAPTSTPWLERVVAGAALLAVAPALGAIFVAVRVLSGRRPLIAHQRVGQFGQTLWTWKVRTMWGKREASCESAKTAAFWEYLSDPSVPAVKVGPDPRVTSKFAAWCRKHSIDEIPQLALVFAGKMRLVGPRPMTRDELDQHYAECSQEILSVPPGLTGLWQVMGRNRLSYRQRRRLDLVFVRRYSGGLYWRILVRTVREVLIGRDAS